VGYALLCGLGFGAEPSKISEECGRINSTVVAQVVRGAVDDAQRVVSGQLTDSLSRTEPTCAGLLYSNIAAGLQRSGRLDEAEHFAERAIAHFQVDLPPDDRVYLRPLEILASVDLAQQRIAKARDVFRRMQMVRLADPSDRVLILSTGCALLELEEKWEQAALQLTGALSALIEAGKRDSADHATMLGELATVYIHENRYHEAGTVLDRALNILGGANDAGPLDRVKLLNSRAVVCVHQNRWKRQNPLWPRRSLCVLNSRG